MKKKVLFSVLCVLVVGFFCVLKLCANKETTELNFNELYNKKDELGETVNIYEDSNQGARIYIDNKYGPENVDSMRPVRKSTYDVPGYNQHSLNVYYKKVNGIEVKGTCEIVSCLEMLIYYDNIDNDFSVNDSIEDAFVKIFDACIKDGSTTYTDGTKARWVDDCIDVTFKTYGSSRRGNINWYYLFENISDSVNSKNPIILDIPGHSVVVRGLETFNAYIKSGNSNNSVTETKKEQFVAIVTGWNDPEDAENLYPYGIYPIEKINSNRSKYQVVWAEK